MGKGTIVGDELKIGITSDDVHNAVHRLREKLCAEPSIHGGKKSRCDLQKEAQKLGGNLV